MLSKLGDRISAFFRATAPDPFVLAILLTLLTLALAALLTPASLHDSVRYWSSAAKTDGFPNMRRSEDGRRKPRMRLL